jgi:hypothetical protein
VRRFATASDAKEFLIGRIADQAQRSGLALSDVERKMLYFSETESTLPEIGEVNAAFERDYDQTQYEKKIVKLVRQLRARQHRDKTGNDVLWNQAVDKLRDGDHYLMVMIEAAGAVPRPRGDRLKLVASALAISAIVLAVIWFLADR